MSVVIIIGLLISLAVPGFQKLMSQTQNSRFMADLRMIEGSVHSYGLEMGNWPVESGAGEVPGQDTEYFSESTWVARNSLGGSWDWDKDSYGIGAGISCVGFNVPVSQLTEIDEQIDDGDLSTGLFQLTAANRVTRILEELNPEP